MWHCATSNGTWTNIGFLAVKKAVYRMWGEGIAIKWTATPDPDGESVNGVGSKGTTVKKV
jgi:hypothetical protein